MHTDWHETRNSRARWDIILGVLFVMSFLGVTLTLLAMSDVSAAPDGSGRAVTPTLDHGILHEAYDTNRLAEAALEAQ